MSINRWKTRLTLDTLDERIVPDATPLVQPTDFGPSNSGTTRPANTSESISFLTDESADLDALRKQLAAAQAKLKANNDRIAAIPGEIAGVDKVIAALEADLKTLNADLKTLRDSRDAAQADLDALKAQGITSGELYDAKKSILESRKDQYSLKLAEVNQANASINTAKAVKTALNKESADLAKANTVLQAEIAALEKSIKDNGG